MNAVFIVVFAVSVLSFFFASAPEGAMEALLAGCTDATSFSLKLFASYAVWLSVLTLWQKTGFDRKLSAWLSPLLKKFFPNEREEVYPLLSVNLSANLLGMGNAATPAGIQATKRLSRKNRTVFLVLNATSVQLIPTTLLALRSQWGAQSDILLPTLIVTLFTTVFGVTVAKLLP